MAIDFDFDKPSAKVISPIQLAHVVLRTNNFKNMVDFYKTFLGGEATYENDFLSFLTYDEEHHRIGIAAIPGTGPKATKTWVWNKPSTNEMCQHIAFTFPSLEDLLLAYRQRRARGIEPSWCVNHDATTSIYYHDPDGNMLETQVDSFSTLEESKAFMTSKQFEENPIGADFDPEDHIARLKKGEPIASILKRPNIGPRGPDSLPPRMLGLDEGKLEI